ncbi:MAG: replication factor A [Candidatus Thermoplasmatota archaeon]|nr:replication factor A [Candidatus Thermoplasmatota archaeon]
MKAQDEFKKISGLSSGTQNINIHAKIVSLQQKTLKNDKGETVYFYGILGDDTGTISFTAWTFPGTMRAGDIVELKNCSVREYNNVNRIYIDAKSEVILKPGDSMEVKRTFKELKIKNLTLGAPYVTIEGTVSNILEKDMERDGVTVKLYYGDLEDDTARIRLTSFGVPLKDGDSLRFEGAKVSEYQGRLRLTINDKTKVTPVKLSYKIGDHLLNISEIDNAVGGITVQGFAVTMGPKSGLVIRCSQCNERLEDLRCPDHPDAPQSYDLFAYFTLDDGTGHIQCTGGKMALLPVLGIKNEEFIPSNTSISRRSVQTGLTENILGKSLVVSGDVAKNQMGLSLRARSLQYMNEDHLKKFSTLLEADFQ